MRCPKCDSLMLIHIDGRVEKGKTINNQDIHYYKYKCFNCGWISSECSVGLS